MFTVILNLETQLSTRFFVMRTSTLLLLCTPQSRAASRGENSVVLRCIVIIEESVMLRAAFLVEIHIS